MLIALLSSSLSPLTLTEHSLEHLSVTPQIFGAYHFPGAVVNTGLSKTRLESSLTIEQVCTEHRSDQVSDGSFSHCFGGHAQVSELIYVWVAALISTSKPMGWVQWLTATCCKLCPARMLIPLTYLRTILLLFVALYTGHALSKNIGSSHQPTTVLGG